MTGDSRQTATGTASTTDALDPESLADEPGIEVREATFTHEEADHREAGAAGRAVVGVSDADGEMLLTVREGGDHVILPNGIVERESDWRETARETVETLGVAVELEGVERVRRVDHEREDGTHLETTHHVVFRATHSKEERDEPSIACDDEWTARWVADSPVALDRDGDSVYDDIRLFLD
jgi:ADP-ribose pyrophosphatase YjhB (NUDIX family)